MARTTTLSLSTIWNTGWEKMKQNYWLIIGVAAVTIFASMLSELFFVRDFGFPLGFFAWLLNYIVSIAVSVGATLAFLQIYRASLSMSLLFGSSLYCSGTTFWPAC